MPLIPDPNVPGAVFEDAGDFVPDTARPGVLVVVGDLVWKPDEGRPFNLGLRSRVVDHVAKTVTIDAASDEALLMDYAALTPDRGARAHEGSLRDVVDYVLNKIGATLSGSGPDPDITALWEVTNLHPNPATATDVTGWGLGQGASDLTWVNFGGNGAVQWTAGAGISNVVAVDSPTAYRVTPGSSYVFAVRVRSSIPRTAQAALQWRNGGGSKAMGTVYGTYVTTSATATQQIYVIGVAPAGAEYVYPVILTGGNTAGQFHYADEVLVYEGDELVPWFTGATVDTADYAFGWSDVESPNASSSVRTPKRVDRPTPDVYVWKPGVTAWDFLQPLLAPANVRLFCDELRVWRLVDPATYEVPGYVPVSPGNAVEGVDTIARNDPAVFATGVVVRYAWTDRDGIARTATDSAGTPDIVAVLDYPRPYPGPGAAKKILARRNGSGRTQDVAGLARWEATPGMVASISLPLALDQNGKVQSVDWALDDTAIMRLGTVGLIDVPVGSWLDWDPDEAWQDVDPAITWESLA